MGRLVAWQCHTWYGFGILGQEGPSHPKHVNLACSAGELWDQETGLVSGLGILDERPFMSLSWGSAFTGPGATQKNSVGFPSLESPRVSMWLKGSLWLRFGGVRERTD